MVFTCLLLAAIAFHQADAHGAKYGEDWDYNVTGGLGPANWASRIPKYCNGSRQSPINVNVSDVTYNSSFKPIIFRNYSRAMPGVTFDLGNNGYTAYASIRHDSNTYSFVPIGIEFNGVSYRLAQFHFHWGRNNTRGSEHTIDGKQYPGEMHILHHNVKYSNLTEALKYKDGVIAFGNMIKIGKENPGLKHIMKYFNNITYAYAKPEFRIPSVAMSSFIANESSNYFYYLGSLTTPTCDETITWVLNREPTEMSLAQLGLLRSLKEVDNVTSIGDNYRPVQALNKRIVQTNVKPIRPTTANTTTTAPTTTAKSGAITFTPNNLAFLLILALIVFFKED